MTTKSNIICSKPDIMGGTPVFKGTRVPIKNLLDYLEAGDSLNTFLEHFPSVSRQNAIALFELAKEMLLTRIRAQLIEELLVLNQEKLER
ncbi:MAG: DUF433 domain-containing protein [Xenococcus sp. MO_188.B8]|nr:DUF433 domain-containing protein [Xenococcus sp. MO_188.B8]